jgi:hypothetical protein
MLMFVDLMGSLLQSTLLNGSVYTSVLEQQCNIFYTVFRIGVRVIPWKFNTSESKIYTSPSRILFKFSVQIGLMAKQRSVSWF